MKLEGNYNLGVYNPPSGLDAVIYSQQASTELAMQLNNLKAGRETGFKQNVATSWPKFLDPGINLITSLNNIDIENFIHLLREGWREEETIPTPTPNPSPSPSPTLSLTPTSETPPTRPPNTPPTLPNLDPNCTYDIFILGLEQNQRFEECIGYGSSESSQGWDFRRIRIPTGESNAKFAEPVLSDNGLYYPRKTLKKPIEALVEIRSIGFGRPVIDTGDSIIPGRGVLTTIYDGVKLGGSVTVPDGGHLGGSSVWRGFRGDRVAETLSAILNSWPWNLFWNVDIQLMARCPGDNQFRLVDNTPSPPPPPSPIYRGVGSPPPPGKKMQCCTCNDIATIVENQSIAQLRAQEKLVENLKDHIDKRALEIIIKDLEHLKALNFEEFLKVILKRINESEANLWNGVPR